MNVHASDVNWDQMTEVNEFSMWWSISWTEQRFNEYTGQQFSSQLSKTCHDKMWRILSIGMFVSMALPKSLNGSVLACTSYHTTSAVTYQHASPTALQCHNIHNHNVRVHHHENIRYFTTYSMEYSIPDRLILPHMINKLRSFDGTWTMCVCFAHCCKHLTYLSFLVYTCNRSCPPYQCKWHHWSKQHLHSHRYWHYSQGLPSHWHRCTRSHRWSWCKWHHSDTHWVVVHTRPHPAHTARPCMWEDTGRSTGWYHLHMSPRSGTSCQDNHQYSPRSFCHGILKQMGSCEHQ